MKTQISLCDLLVESRAKKGRICGTVPDESVSSYIIQNIHSFIHFESVL